MMELYKCFNGIFCFFLVVGVNIFISRKFRVCGLEEIFVSNFVVLVYFFGRGVF